MSARIRLGLFAVVAIAQLAIPARMILSRETVLHQGTLYKFHTQPVDPNDPFRGRYVRISVETNPIPIPEGWQHDNDAPVYAVLGADEEGFAIIKDVRSEPPEIGDYIRADMVRVDDFAETITVNLPIDRYYMNEWSAPEAERAYWDNSRIANKNAYVTVRVLDGEAVVEGLYIGDQPIEDYMKNMAATKGGNP